MVKPLSEEYVKGESRRRYGRLERQDCSVQADQGIKRAENHAERMQWEASFAIDFAAAAVEEAKSAVLDAILARVEAEKTKTA